RDIGTIVYPQADLKFFMTATPEERAKRRLKELQSRGIPVIFEEVLQEMIQRDRRDRERQDSPLVAAEDAILIDTSEMSPADVVALAAKAIDKSLA
ncbi:MAG: (d)CMP kinase, partial [Alphaproteobacteria bacterium]|nr:(d)CMP kinase [Alphaproteobacteria bacterium]